MTADRRTGSNVRLTPLLWVMLLVSLALVLAALSPESLVYRLPAGAGHAFTASRVPLVGLAVAITVGVAISLVMEAT